MDSKELKERRVIYRGWILEDSLKTQEHLEIAEKAIRLGERIVNAPNVSVQTKSSKDIFNPSPSVPAKRGRKPGRFGPYKPRQKANSIVSREVKWSHPLSGSLTSVPDVEPKKPYASVSSALAIKPKRGRKPGRFGPYKKKHSID